MATEDTKKKQWVLFLCYSQVDTEFADWLYNKLKSAGLTVWYDKYEIPVSMSITASFTRGVEGSEFFIIIISQQALESKWVEEVLMSRIYVQIEEEQRNHIIPVILEGTESRDLPFFLKDKQGIRFPKSGSNELFQKLLGDIGKLREISETEAQSEPKNPFGMRGVVEPRLFIVTEVVNQITKDTAARNSVFIVGPSKMGKSSLLKFLDSPLYRSYYYKESNSSTEPLFTYLNLQEHIPKSCGDLLYVFADAMSITHGIKKKSRKSNSDNHKEALNRIKDIVGKKQAGRPLSVVLLDTFDRINEFGGLSAALFDDFYILAEEYNICFFIASRRNAEDLPLPQGIGTSQFISLLKKYFLKVWDVPTARKLLFEPYGNVSSIFSESDFAYMTHLTARHPFLLQIACFHLFEALKKGKEAVDLGQLLENYLVDAESVYRLYLDYEISKPERKWLIDCWRASSQRGKNAQDTLQKLALGQKNRNIRNKLVRLGLVLNSSGILEIPTGLQRFLEDEVHDF